MTSLPSDDPTRPATDRTIAAVYAEWPGADDDWLAATASFPESPQDPLSPENRHKTNRHRLNLHCLSHRHKHTMPDISQMTESKFLKRGDVGKGALLTIVSCEQMNVAKANEPHEMKWCLSFEEVDKPMVLNKTNAELIGMISNERNSDNWGGVKIVAYDDPSISYAGKLVGGIRVRAPRGQASQRPPVAKPASAQLPQEEDDDIPF